MSVTVRVVRNLRLSCDWLSPAVSWSLEMVDTVEDMVVHVSSIRDGGPDPGTDIDKIDSANIKQV